MREQRVTSEPLPIENSPASTHVIPTAKTTLVALMQPSESAVAALDQIWPDAARFNALPMAVGDATDEQRSALSEIDGAIVSHVGDRYAGLARLLDAFDAMAHIWRAGREELSHPALGGNLGPNLVYEPTIIKTGDGRLVIDSDESVTYQTRAALCPAVNASLQTPTVDWPTTPLDPVNITTALVGLSQLPVFAAGNLHQYAVAGQESMSAWAEMPWVLAVGASDDPAGTTLAPYSARGIPGIPDSGPDIVAYGASIFDPQTTGTSFAAPQVSGGAVLCAAVIEQLRFHVEKLRGGEVHGVPLVGYALIDEFGDDPLPIAARTPVPALPPMAVDVEALARAVALLNEAKLPLDLTVTPNRLRWMLLASAQPMPRFAPHEVGVGFYSEEGLLGWLSNLTAAQLAWLGAPRPPGSAALHTLADLPILIEADLKALARVVKDTAPVWRYDIRTGAFGMRPDQALPTA